MNNVVDIHVREAVLDTNGDQELEAVQRKLPGFSF